ncbi:hypothetical protein AWB81_07965 [Caballeronia arationis]|uniref:hypothetical protein n=1 Tax=Caballeronia arationis TaxID=1777142 RepID=UPI00074B5ABD|nr:hypothetical protein [Caballeronia arationis]SAL07218.1 hypothetical protein AWB81_07965 [Caballeronia arationis]
MDIAPILTTQEWIAGYYAKRDFHFYGAKFLRSLAVRIGLERGTHHVRSNMGGNAVSGEVYLMHDKLYMWITQSFNYEVVLFYRACNGRRDHIGGENNSLRVADLADEGRAAAFVERCQRIINCSSS